MSISNFGRKIFFVYPNNLISNEIIIPLIDREYEVYPLNDHNQIPIIAKRFENSVLFLNIDEKLTIGEWDKIIWNFEKSGENGNYSLGIFSHNHNKNIQQKYATRMTIESGFHSLRQRPSNLLGNVKTVLDRQNVKENRKFIRASFLDNSYRFELMYKGLNRQGYIHDLSSAGMTIIFDKSVRIEKNSLLKDISLFIKESVIHISGVFLGTQRDREDKVVYVILFDKALNDVSRSRIRLVINRHNREVIHRDISALELT